MKQKLLFLVCLLVFPIEMLADDLLATLIVQTKDGAETAFFLKDQPQVKFEGNNLKVTYSSGEATFALADMLRFTFDKRSSSGINETVVDPTQVAFQDDVLVISQLKANSSVYIYAVDGKLIRQLDAHRAGTYRLNLSELPVGLYLVKADNVTYKIMKR